MKLHEIIPTAQAIIAETDAVKELPRFAGPLGNQKKEFEAALEETGLALVFIQESGDPAKPNAPDLYLENILIIAVVENVATNQTGLSNLEAVGHVLKALHQYDWPGKGLRNVLTVDNPAYTRGDLGSGLFTNFCNFKIKTIE